MKRLISVLVLVFLLIGAAAPVYAQGTGRAGLVSFGRDIVVQAGEVIDGDVVALGGNVTVESTARVNGDVVAVGGDVTAAANTSFYGDIVAVGGSVSSAGEVNGSVIAVGGDADLRMGSLVRQDAITFGGNVRQAEGARVQGNVSRGFVFYPNRNAPGAQLQPPLPFDPGFSRPWTGNFALSVLMAFVAGVLKIVVLAAVAVALVAIFPRQIGNVKATLTSQPAASTGVGCLTYLVAIALTLPLLLTCIGNFLMWPILIIATIFGVGAVGLILGERLTGSGVQPRSPAFNAALGTGLIVLVLVVLDAVPFVACFSWVFWLLVASLATGAVVLSKFGTELPASVQAPMPTRPSGTSPELALGPVRTPAPAEEPAIDRTAEPPTGAGQ
jgi:hypothetical protein